MTRRTKVDNIKGSGLSPKQRAFLGAYAETGSVSAAVRLSKVGRSSHYEWLNDAAEYRSAFREAHSEACDALEAEARRRAVSGIEETVYHQGKPVGTVRKYSDTLLIFLMKGAMPSKYRERLDLNAPADILERLPDKRLLDLLELSMLKEER
jgi:hypothetical protein